jgi:LPXTG-site transpeptidase (sortase) family protein
LSRSEPRGRGRKVAQSGLWRIIGAILIVGGLGVLGYLEFQKAMVVYHQNRLRQNYQEALIEIPEPVEKQRRIIFTEWQPARIVIPKINVNLIVQNGDVFDEEMLNKGPVHFQMSDLPGTEPGNVAIAAHRGVRWGFFTDIDLLEAGDNIYLDFGGYRFIYLVQWTRIVDPYDWSVIESTPYPALTLQTCEPKHASATHRLIVRGALSEVTYAPRPGISNE